MTLSLVKPTIAELRQRIGATDLSERSRTAFSLYPAGFATGSLVDISGAGKTEFLAHFLREQSELNVAWVEETISINPYALRQRGVRLKNILFVEAQKELSWCLNQVLHSGCFPVVITENKNFGEKDMRRFQLLAERSKSIFFLLSELRRESWVPHLQLEIVKENKALRVKVLKKRGHG